MSGVRWVEPLDAMVQLWPPPAPADRIVAILAVPGRTWRSHGGSDQDEVYHEACFVAFEGPSDGGTVIVKPDGRWTMRTLCVDGTSFDCRRFIPEMIRDRIGELARLLLEDAHDPDAPTNGDSRSRIPQGRPVTLPAGPRPRRS